MHERKQGHAEDVRISHTRIRSLLMLTARITHQWWMSRGLAVVFACARKYLRNCSFRHLLDSDSEKNVIK